MNVRSAVRSLFALALVVLAVFAVGAVETGAAYMVPLAMVTVVILILVFLALAGRREDV